ncbi:MAG TPA: hypothetical protein VJ756_07190 [Terriglobales bacterium]|nr:hypothetical protein [Terriglobales bacterium]
MPLLHSSVKLVTKKMPKFISPRTHAVLDYVTAGAFLAGGILLLTRRRDKRAGISALMCGAAETITSLLTDYPGGVTGLISFPTHGKIDMGLAAMTATLPEFMDFKDGQDMGFFRAQAVLITANTGLTDFGRGRNYDEAYDQEAA